MRKFKVIAEAKLQVAVWVEAESEDHAVRQAELMGDWEFEDDGDIEVIEIKEAREV